MSAQTGANICLIISIWMRGSPGWELCSHVLYTEAVELRISNANKRGLPAASSSHLVGPARGRSSVWLPLPICGEMSNVNMNPVNFHKFVTASLAYTEASHSLPPS